MTVPNLFFLHDDYTTLIRADVFDVIKDYDESLRYQAEAFAIEEAAGYLRGRYADELGCLLFSVTAHDPATTYGPYDHVWYGGLMYVCMQPGTTTAPPPVYDPSQTYTAGDVVCLGTAVYQCQVPATSGPFAAADWQQIAPVWVQRDRRQPVLLMYLLDLVLYHLHSRLNPRQIPPLRLERYERALDWLADVQAGKIILDPDCPGGYAFPPLTLPGSGATGLIEWGSRRPRRENYY